MAWHIFRVGYAVRCSPTRCTTVECCSSPVGTNRLPNLSLLPVVVPSGLPIAC